MEFFVWMIRGVGWDRILTRTLSRSGENSPNPLWVSETAPSPYYLCVLNRHLRIMESSTTYYKQIQADGLRCHLNAQKGIKPLKRLECLESHLEFVNLLLNTLQTPRSNKSQTLRFQKIKFLWPMQMFTTFQTCSPFKLQRIGTRSSQHYQRGTDQH